MADQDYVELTPDRRPQDPTFDGAGWKFELLDHGGDYPDTMPQAIRATDAQGRSCIYVPLTIDGRVVDIEPGEEPSLDDVATPRNIL